MQRSAWHYLAAASLILLRVDSVTIAEEVKSDQETVGSSADGRVVTPVNQVLTPNGRQLDLPGMRPQVLAMSPDGKLLATAGKTSDVVIIDPVDGSIRQHVGLPSEVL